MLSLLKIKNIALIDELEIEFGSGLNLLTGETGSGKSIIVDSLAALTGERVSSDLIKEGAESARIEGIFHISNSGQLTQILAESGIESEDGGELELIVRRDLAQNGRNRVFINGQLATAGILKKIGGYLVDIHGQGEQTALFDTSSHLAMLDEFAGNNSLIAKTSESYAELSSAFRRLRELRTGEEEKLQLIDILKFQINELSTAALFAGEEDGLQEEKLSLANVEKINELSLSAYSLLYENDASTLATLDKATRDIATLGNFNKAASEHLEGLQSARAIIEEAAVAARNILSGLDFSPGRLAEIEDRLAEISRLTRKYGGNEQAAIAHLADAEQRLAEIETADVIEKEVLVEIDILRKKYISAAGDLSRARYAAAKQFELAVKAGLDSVALEKARFKIHLNTPAADELISDNSERHFTANGFDAVEFYFSANIGESPKPLVKVASGGEASRLMLILKTAALKKHDGKAVVFDEIDSGIGGRVAEAVGTKLKQLSLGQQVLCVTHQPQVASKANRHYIVEKEISGNKTRITLRQLNKNEQIEELARMLAGETITDAARQNAREMIASAN